MFLSQTSPIPCGSHRYRLLLSAATDGNVALWDVTTTTSLLPVTLSDTTAPPAPCLTVPAHQSGVNSLAVWEERTEDGCLVTVASGGDDGQLTMSVVKVQYPEVKTEGSRVPLTQRHPSLTLLSQARVSLAHSAPLTALSLLAPGLLVSTSPDQRVRLWRACGAGLHHAGALYSHIADAAALVVWGAERGPSEEEGGGYHGDGEVTANPGSAGDESRGASMRGTRRCGDLVLEGSVAVGQARGDGGTAGQMGWVVVCGQGLQLLRVMKLFMTTGLG